MKKGLLSKFVVLGLFVFASLNIHFKPNQSVNWVTLEKAYELSKIEPRMTVIDMYTDWCGWCRKMESTTYRNPEVVNYLNQKCYPVKFNAESKETIKIGNNTFKYSPEKRIHEAAAVLMGGRASYPTTVFLKNDFSILQAVPGYMNEKDFRVVINYLGGEHYKSTPFEAYKKSFKN